MTDNADKKPLHHEVKIGVYSRAIFIDDKIADYDKMCEFLNKWCEMTSTEKFRNEMEFIQLFNGLSDEYQLNILGFLERNQKDK